MDLDEKVLYEYQTKRDDIFRVTTKRTFKMFDDKIYDNIYKGVPLEIIDYKGHVIISFSGQTILYTKMYDSEIGYLELKHIYYEGIMYRFRSSDLGKYYLVVFNAGVCLISGVYIPAEDFKVMTACDLLKKYLTSIGRVFDKSLVDNGIIIYRKYWDPTSALGLIRDRLHDLIVVTRK